MTRILFDNRIKMNLSGLIKLAQKITKETFITADGEELKDRIILVNKYIEK